MKSLLEDKKLIFICGLHRSGTSVLHELLKAQDAISGFNNTGVPEDEGQFLQTVYKQAYHYGGPGKFGFHAEAALTEKSNLATAENSKKLLAEWAQHWDMSKLLLVEKSPPNLIRTRFLQQLFPAAYFIILIRHPVAVTGATKKWSTSSRYSLVKHWVVCHQRFRQDAPHLRNKLIITYEELTDQPEITCNKIAEFLGVPILFRRELVNTNRSYFAAWQAGSWNPLRILERKRIEHTFEEQVNVFGYSFADIAGR